jgi:hypothetical protein
LEDLPFNAGLGDMPDVFTPFKEKCEKRSTVSRTLGVHMVWGFFCVTAGHRKAADVQPAVCCTTMAAADRHKPAVRSMLLRRLFSWYCRHSSCPHAM